MPGGRVGFLRLTDTQQTVYAHSSDPRPLTLNSFCPRLCPPTLSLRPMITCLSGPCFQASPPPSSALQMASQTPQGDCQGGRRRAHNSEGREPGIPGIRRQGTPCRAWQICMTPWSPLSHLRLPPIPPHSARTLAPTLEISRGLGTKENPQHPVRKPTCPSRGTS